MSNLKDVHAFYVPQAEVLDKETRNIFVHGTVDDIMENMEKLIEYNFDDVEATFRVFRRVFPLYISRFGSPVTMFGTMVMGKPKMYINRKAWSRYGEYCESTFNQLKTDTETRIFDMAVETYKKYEKEWQATVCGDRAGFCPTDSSHSWNNNPFITQLDWT